MVWFVEPCKTLNKMLDAEAQEMCNAQRYERTEARQDCRAGFYQRGLSAGRRGGAERAELRRAKFETAIIERYRRRESSIEEALMEMYLAGVSVRRVEDITEALWGMRVSAGTVSDLNQKLYERIERWRNQPITGESPYLYLNGICLKRSWAGEVRNVSVLVAVGVGTDRVPGYPGGRGRPARGRGKSRRQFLTHLKGRGLTGVQLIVSDKCMGLVEAATEFVREAHWQRCVVHWYRNIFGEGPKNKKKKVAAMLKAIHAQEDAASAQEKATAVVEKLKALKLKKAAEKVAESVAETLTYYRFPSEHHRQIRTNNMLERMIREIRRRTRIMGVFPDGRSA